MTHWYSLFLSSDTAQALQNPLETFFEQTNFTRYNPFGVLPGMAYPQTLKLFVAPAQDGWVRLLLDSDTDPHVGEALAQHLSQTIDCLSIQLSEKIAQIHGYRSGELVALNTWCLPYLKDSDTAIDAIINAESFDLEAISKGQIGDVPLETLPEDIQQMARDVNVKQANKLFEKLSNRLLKAVSRQSARSMMLNMVDWDSQGGQYIRALLSQLTIPDGWRDPDFATLRTAYAIKTRQEQGMTTFYPGDEGALNAVLNVFDYQPYYGGKIDV